MEVSQWLYNGYHILIGMLFLLNIIWCHQTASGTLVNFAPVALYFHFLCKDEPDNVRRSHTRYYSKEVDDLSVRDASVHVIAWNRTYWMIYPRVPNATVYWLM